MNRTDLDNGMNERETLDADESKIANLLRALPRVEAPSNFDFGVKAKIASGRPNTGVFSLLKVAAPLTLVLAVGAFVLFYGVLPSDDADGFIATVEPPVTSQPAHTEELQASQSEVAVDPPSSSRESGPLVPEERSSAKVETPRTSDDARRTPRVGNNSSPGAGSLTETQKVAPVLTPPGIPAVPGTAETSVEELFQILGVKADLVGRDWTVRSTAENSLAARAGLKTNDVIEAIDNLSLSAKKKIKGFAGGKSCQIRRDGKRLTLDLRN